MWILCAGQNLFVQVVQVPIASSIREEKGSMKPGPLFIGPSFGLERWRFWKNALAAAIEREGAGDECKRLAHRAVDLMDAIERNMLL